MTITPPPVSLHPVRENDDIRGVLQAANRYLAEAVGVNSVHDYTPAIPPSTFRTCPVMYLASSEARKATASATSRGEPM